MALEYTYTNLEKAEKQKQSFYAFLPGAFSWGILLGFGVCSFIRPVWAILILIIFDFYWVLFLLHTFLLFWGSKCCPRKKKAVGAQEDPVHVVFIPVGTESAENLETRLESLHRQEMAHARIFVFFALSNQASDKLRKIVWDFHRNTAHAFAATYIFPCEAHPPGTYGMGADLNATAHMATHVFELRKIPEEQILVTCLGPESCLAPGFLTCLADTFLDCPDRHACGFRPQIQFPQNFWEDPKHAPVWNFGSALLMIFDRIHPYNPGSFCPQSLSFKALRSVGFWPEGFQSTDGALYWKAFLHFSGKYKIIPLKTGQPLVADSTPQAGRGIRKTFARNYEWASGMENFPVLMRLLRRQSNLFLIFRIWLAGRLIVQQVSNSIWALFFVLLGWLPGIATALGFYSGSTTYLAPQILLSLGLISTVGFLLTFILCCALLPKPAQKMPFAYWGKKIFAGLLLPIVLPWCSCVPLLVTQSRLMFGRDRSNK
ncbi:hypothetical protein P0Y35_12275 [Kiritimatiellaeota bacterium B1221]|nr:hypothetical protein [Kiritimatiellaeota bacterium B1221]